MSVRFTAKLAEIDRLLADTEKLILAYPLHSGYVEMRDDLLLRRPALAYGIGKVTP